MGSIGEGWGEALGTWHLGSCVGNVGWVSSVLAYYGVMVNDGDLVELTVRPNEMQAGLVRAVLEEAGIESWTAVAGGVMSNAEFGNVFVPTSVLVRPSDAAAARVVLENTRADSVDIDWSEVDTGDDSPLTDDEILEKYGERPDRRSHVKWYLLAVAVLMIGLMLFS